MCGIVGIVPRAPGDPRELEAAVRRMATAIVHRGPDDEGFHISPDVALGVRRLSIIDVAGGHQPIATEDGNRLIVFNGEIYNYREIRRELESAGQVFRTRSDTEVALRAWHAWGEAGLERLEGMYGLALWDGPSRTLLLARDPIGQKSIYTAETTLGLAFASEIKALLALGLLPRELDLEGMGHYMSMRYLPGAHTFFRGISKLPASGRLRVHREHREAFRGWARRYQPKWQGSESELLDALDGLLRSVVREHLMSEVPLGAFLSGGIDSSLVVAYAATEQDGPLSTFSIGVDDASQSELPWARKVAERYRTRHREEIVEPDLAGLAPRMVLAMEEPVDPLAAGVFVVSRVAAEEVTVCLGGDGGDELFAGYDRYLGQRLAEVYATLPPSLRRRVLRPLLRLVPDSFGYNSVAARLRWLDRMAEKRGFERYAESAAFLRFPHEMKRALFTEEAWKRVGAHPSEELLRSYFEDGRAEAFVDRMLYADSATRLADHQCPILDKMSMAHSLEVRSPFLDRRVVDFAARIPARWQMKRGRIKYVTRRLAERYLPRELVYRRKQGFGFPLAHWIRGELRGLFDRVVEESHLVEAGIFRREEMRRLLAEHVEGALDHNYRLWMLFNLELFHRLAIEETPLTEVEAWVEATRR